MRLRLTLAALTGVVMLVVSAGRPAVGGAEPPPTPPYALYLPLVAVPPPTPTVTATATSTATATLTPTPTVTPTRTNAAACMGDEEMSFAPNPGATGSPLVVSVTSARASVYVALQVAYGGAGVGLAGPAVNTGGKGYIWAWTFTPAQPGRYDASFYVNQSVFCAGDFVQVNGNAVPTATRTPTPAPPTATPTPAPTAPPGSVVWDWRLSFLRVGISGASVAPGQKYWRVTRGVFENHIEGGGGHSIAVEILDEWGNRLSLPFGTEVGYAANGGQIPLEWTKLDEAYPVVYGIYGPLGSYSVWITVGGLPSERVYGMGLVASDGTDAPLLAEGGKVHVNYLITFRRTTRQTLETALAPSLLDCYPGRRWLPSPPNEKAEAEESGPAASPLRRQRYPMTPGFACLGPGH